MALKFCPRCQQEYPDDQFPITDTGNIYICCSTCFKALGKGYVLNADGRILVQASELYPMPDGADIGDTFDDEQMELEDWWENPDKKLSIGSGFREIDERYGGFFPNEITVLAGRPSSGKSSLSQSIGINIARACREFNQDLLSPKGTISNQDYGTTLQDKRYVLIFSVEMSRRQLKDRWLSQRLDIPHTKLRRTSTRTILSAAKVETIEQLREMIKREYYSLPIIVNDKCGISADYIEKQIKQWQGIYNIVLVVVDYMQLLTSPSHSNKMEKVGYSADRLMQSAKDCGLPILALSQINRENEWGSVVQGRPMSDKARIRAAYSNMPTLANLSQSDQIGQNATNVWILHRPAMYLKRPDDIQRKDAYLNVNKCRYGETDVVPLKFVAGKFVDWDTRSEARTSLDKLTPEESV